MKREEEQYQAKGALGQTEHQFCSLPQSTRGRYRTYGEYLADLAVFLDDALAVQQTETVTFHNLIVEEVAKLFFGHPLSCILYGNLYIVSRLSG